MDIKHEGRQLALALVNMDDLVLAGQLSSGSVSLLSFAGRSLVGTAVAGAGIATRAAVLGAQVATKSALAVAGAAKGTIPGAGLAEQMVYDLDQSMGRGGQTASFVASQGVAIGKAESRPPAEPIFGDPWLGKRLRPGATVGSVFVDSAVDLTRLAVLPLTLGTATLASAMASPAGQEVTRTFWNAFSSIVDGVAGRSASGGTNRDRSEQRAMLLMVGMAPLVTASQDIVDLGEALARATAGDGARLRALLTTILARLQSNGSTDAAQHTPARLLSALGDTRGSDGSRVGSIGRAIVDDRDALSRLVVAYTTMVADLVTSAAQSAVQGSLDVGDIDAWVRADETAYVLSVAASPDTPPAAATVKCPSSVQQLETLVASFSTGDRQGFYVPATIELARDTIFSYSYRALGRETALARMERLFGSAVRDRLRDDCSLWGEILDAKRDRDARIAALVSQLQGEGRTRLREARDHAAARLASLAGTSPDRMLEAFMPQRICERIEILQRFVAMADTANALDRDSAVEAARQRSLAQLADWVAAPAFASEAQHA